MLMVGQVRVPPSPASGCAPDGHVYVRPQEWSHSLDACTQRLQAEFTIVNRALVENLLFKS
jgi:hypothetical protein